MKIYTRIVMDLTQDDLPVIEAEGFEHDGPLALCWGVGADGHDGREGGGGSFGNDSSHGAGPSGLGDDGPSGDQGGQNHGWGGYGDPDAPGAMSPGNPDSLGGGRPSPDSVGTDRGGWTSSPHGNPHGAHLSHDEGPPSLSDVDSFDARRDQAIARQTYGFINFRDRLRGLADVGRYGGLAAAAGVLTGNPIGFARGVYGLGSFATDAANAREAAGMPSRGGPGTGLGEDDGHGGDALAQTQQATSPADPRTLPERGIAGPGAEGMGTVYGERPPDGEVTTDDLARISEGSPMRNALKLAFTKDMDTAKRGIITQALQGQRGAA